MGFLDCAECHGSHDLRPADGTMLEGLGAACQRCHGEGQEVYTRVQRLMASAERLDAAREAWGEDDPRRLAVIDAIHALDADALDHALEGAPAPTPDAPHRASRLPARVASPWRLLAPIGGGVVIVGLIAFVLVRLSRRKKS
jgi:hypothetical protein